MIDVFLGVRMIFRSTRAFSSLICLSLLAFSCKTSSSASDTLAEGDAVKLSLNDVSILMPYEKVPELFQLLPLISDKPDPEKFAKGLPTAPLDNESFVPRWAIEEIGSILRDNRTQLDAELEKRNTAEVFDETAFTLHIDYDARREETIATIPEGGPFRDVPYRIASLRIDPCPNIIDAKGNDKACVRQLRIIWQRMRNDHGIAGVDNNIHAVYQLTNEEFTDLLTTLRALHKAASVDTMKDPLSPHPVIAAEGANGPYLKGIIGLIHRYARASKLTNVAFLTDSFSGGGGHWPMTQFSIKANKPIRVDIPATIKQPSLSTFNLVQRMDGNRGSLTSPAPVGSSADTLFPEDNGTKFNGTTEAFVYRSSYLIENPLRNDALRLDCASCHTAFAQKANAWSTLNNKNIIPTLPKEAFTSDHWNLSNVTGRVVSDKNKEIRLIDETSLQMFSYFNGEVKISQRAINESAVVADYINEKLKK